jgi:Fe-S-cluster-containing dehydrogenase component
MKVVAIDSARCINCSNCHIACKDEYCDNDWSPVAAPQGKGQFWIRIQERQAARGTRMRLERIPVMCQHCARPSCIESCKAQAIYKRSDGIVIIDPELCNGCGACQHACGYGVIFENTERKIFQKCTLCAHLLDNGWEQPRCVTVCPVDALAFVEHEELRDENNQAPIEKLWPELGTQPRVTYFNLPKPFLAGAVFSPQEDLCLENVELNLSCPATGASYASRTDFLGEFKIDNIRPGIYDLCLFKDGYGAKKLSKLDIRSSLNVDEIQLRLVAQR